MAKFMDLLGCREITMKSDTEPAIIAFRNRVAEMCKAEVETEPAVMLTRGIVRTSKCHTESRTREPLSDESHVLLWLVEHPKCILFMCWKGGDGRTPFERLHSNKPSQ